MKSLAIIFTCFNRKKITESCLKNLIKQAELLQGKIVVEVYVCDDGSTDGTEQVLRNSGQNVHIIKGESLFWNRGMYEAMSEAVKSYHDYYLMINDDVDFYSDAIETMLLAHRRVEGNCGITGATKSHNSEITTYGGRLFRSREFISPNGTLQHCDLANWNCFLVDEKIISDIGIIDSNYDHSYGDYDYSMRMQRRGYDIFVADKYIGECERNSIKGTFKDKTLSKKRRMQLFFSPKGMSIKSIFRYYVRNMDYLGVSGLMISLMAYIRNLIVILVS